jgi:HAD superfamily hydrolase (TIGR01450 family)
MSRRGPSTVAVVGLGGMGSRIARRLLRAGYQVIVWNRSREKTSSLLELGALPVHTPAEAAARARVVITMVSDPEALRDVTEGPTGIVAGAGTSSTVVEMSTVGPAAVERLRSALPERTGLLDAPVLGSLKEAESGLLTIFVGGPRPLFDQARPILSELGTPIHAGNLGCGAAAKLVANAAHFDTLVALGEAVALSTGLGLSRAVTYQVLAATPLALQAERRRRAIETRDYPTRFALTLARKDARLISAAAAAAGVRLKLTSAAETWLAESEEFGLGNQDYTAVLDAILHGGHCGGIAGQVAPSVPTQYDGLIVDLDGVVWRGGAADMIEGAADAIAAIRAQGTQVLFLTNDPRRSRGALAAALSERGIPSRPDEVMTSAAATARVLGSLDDFIHRTALVVGASPLHEEVAAAGFRLVALEDATDAEAVVVGAHEGFDYRELRAATAAIRNGARLYATGRDAVFPTPEGPWPATGSILAAIEAAGGRAAVVVGKPEPIVFGIAREALTGCERIGVVGDHLVSDVLGAKRAGLDAILVLTGVTTRAELTRAMVQPDLVLESLAALVKENTSQ